MITAQVCIGDPVVVEPGIYVPHGQIVVDGLTKVRSGAVLYPWVTVGLISGNFNGPTIGKNVHVGTGAKVLGPITLAQGARVGANAVVLSNVPARGVAVGVPAKVRPARTRG
jgi:serine O-acetyltransferase